VGPSPIIEARQRIDGEPGSPGGGAIPASLLVICHRPVRIPVVGDERVKVEQGSDLGGPLIGDTMMTLLALCPTSTA
jgi:hypothetical protein